MRRSITRGASTLAIAVVGIAGLAACEPAPPTCDGRAATIRGTANAEVITGTAGDDVIAALGGHDTVNGLGGNDVICGDAGNDVISGGAGNDTLLGGDGTDTATWASVTAAVTADLGSGTATGEGSDGLRTFEGLTGGAGADTLTGNTAGNTLTGGAGNDTMVAGAGNDTCAAGAGTDTGSDCEAVSGSVDPVANQDTYTNTVAGGRLFFLDSATECSGPDILWSMAGPADVAFSPRRICNDWERVPNETTATTLTVGGQGGTATGTYSFRLHQPVDATGTITAGGSAVNAAVTTPGQNVRLTFSGTAGQVVSIRNLNASFPDGYYVNLLKPNGAVRSYSSHSIGTGFMDAVALDATGTWTVEVNPNADSTGSTSIRLYTVVDQTGSLSVGGPTAAANITTPGQNARFTFSGTSGQKVTVRMSGGTMPRGAFISLLRPNGTTLNYGSGYETAIINGATLDTSGTWTVFLDASGDGTGQATLEIDPA